MVKAECTVCEIHAESTFRIDGMDCREEVAILERRLKHLPGLEDFVADLVGQRLRVRYDAAKLSTSAISEAIGQTGMRAWLEHEHPVGHSAAATSRQVLVAISGASLAAFRDRLRSLLGTPVGANQREEQAGVRAGTSRNAR